MPKHLAGDNHCVDCESFGLGATQCPTRLKIEDEKMHDLIDKAIEEGVEEKVYFVLYSFVCKCDNWKRKRATTAEEVLTKIIAGEALTEEEQTIADRVLKGE